MCGMLNLTDLRGRGWTEKLIEKFLDLKNPDMTASNPYKRSGPRIKYYAAKRIERIETTKRFKAQMEIAKPRKAAAKKNVETKRAKILDYIENVRIEVPVFDETELIQRACAQYNDRRPDSQCYKPLASSTSDREFLERITVNYLRHCCSKYEVHLQKITGKVGKHDAYFKLKTKVLGAIETQYDWLVGECSNQFNRSYEQD